VPSLERTKVRRLNRRTSLLVASTLVLIGILRFVTDVLHERDPDYWMSLAGSWLRYLVRAPADGTLLGTINAQWFKLLAIPSGISLIYLRDRFAPGMPASNEATFHDWAVRGVWIAVFWLGFTVIEIEKQLSPFGMGAQLVKGEDPLINHIAHIIGAVLAWKLAGALSMTDP
jgi:hypothetical protein